jgi:hypothetical protein
LLEWIIKSAKVELLVVEPLQGGRKKGGKSIERCFFRKQRKSKREERERPGEREGLARGCSQQRLKSCSFWGDLTSMQEARPMSNPKGGKENKDVSVVVWDPASVFDDRLRGSRPTASRTAKA